MNRQRGPAGLLKRHARPVHGSYVGATRSGLGVIATAALSRAAGALALREIAGIGIRIHGALSLMMGTPTCAVPVPDPILESCTRLRIPMVTMRGTAKTVTRTCGQTSADVRSISKKMPRSRCRYFSSFRTSGHSDASAESTGRPCQRRPGNAPQ